MGTDLSISKKLETVLICGDLSGLNEQERVSYYKAVCESVGLNPLTQPFAYIILNGKLQLYARKDCTDQLRSIHNVSIKLTEKKMVGDVFIVSALATKPDGRTDESTGAVSIEGLRGEKLANAFMKSETKSKRRVTLSICGLGMLDETEVETIKGAEFPDIGNKQPKNAQAEDRLPTPEEAAKLPPSTGQLRMFWAIGTKNGWTEQTIKALIHPWLGTESSKQWDQDKYQRALGVVESQTPEQFGSREFEHDEAPPEESGFANVTSIMAPKNFGSELKCPKCGATPMRQVLANTMFYGCTKWRDTGCKGSINANQETGEPIGDLSGQMA